MLLKQTYAAYRPGDRRIRAILRLLREVGVGVQIFALLGHVFYMLLARIYMLLHYLR